MSEMVELEVAGEIREVEIDNMTRAELKVASFQGSKTAEEELDRRRRSL